MEALRKENSELKQAIFELTIEKNRLQDQLYRAFRKCLNSKKRKISQLQEELDNLKNENPSLLTTHTKSKRPKILDSEEEEGGGDSSDSSDTNVDEEMSYQNQLSQHEDGENITFSSFKDTFSPSISSSSSETEDEDSFMPTPQVVNNDNQGDEEREEEELPSTPTIDDQQQAGVPKPSPSAAIVSDKPSEDTYDLDELTKDL